MSNRNVSSQKHSASSRGPTIVQIVVPIIVALVGSAGFWQYLQSRPPSPACQITATPISLERTVILVNQSIKASVRANNPDGRPLLYNWQAVHGQMNPSVRSNTPQSVYIAPTTPVDDVISVDITLPDCEPMRLTQSISVLEPSTPTQTSTSTPPSVPTGITTCSLIVGNWKFTRFDGQEPSFGDITVRVKGLRFLADGTFTGTFIYTLPGGGPSEDSGSGTYSCIDADTIKLEGGAGVSVYDVSISGAELKLIDPTSYTMVLQRIP